MKVLGCGIFRRELEAVAPGWATAVQWLSPGLHADLEAMRGALDEALAGAEGAACLFGACDPDIDRTLQDHGAARFPGKDCVAAFLDDGERAVLEARRAFVMTPGWLRHWREIFQQAIGWDTFDARQNFGFYDSVVLLDFGLEPIDELEVLEFFEFTQTPVEVVPADLARFRTQLSQLLGTDLETAPGP